MLKYLLKQPLNAWRELSRLNKIEVFLLVGLIYIISIGKIHEWYLTWLTEDLASPAGLSALITHVFIISIFLSGPFILFYLIPKQPGLQPFYTKPLSMSQLLQLTGYFYFKYQLIAIIIYLVFLAPLFAIGWMPGLASVLLFIIFALIVYLVQFILFIKRKNNFRFWIKLLIIVGLYHTFFVFFYWYSGFFWIFEISVLTGVSILLWRIWVKMDSVHLELIFPHNFTWKKYRHSGRLDFSKLPRFLPQKTQVLFNKELLGLWRNPSYRRLKIITFLSYAFLMIVIFVSGLENMDVYMTILTGLTIWLHYSNYFNEKYVQPEPDWYFHTIPFRFRQLWLSKFMVEFIFIIALLAGFWILLFISGFNLYEQFNLLVIILFFSIIVLAVMLNFQIMFYDDPRLAGYAYHFTILFLAIMIVNYRLVGPIISIFLLAYFYYKSYRYFNS
jgi:hypothetical protein